jgi:hypothetical protein
MLFEYAARERTLWRNRCNTLQFREDLVVIIIDQSVELEFHESLRFGLGVAFGERQTSVTDLDGKIKAPLPLVDSLWSVSELRRAARNRVVPILAYFPMISTPQAGSAIPNDAESPTLL